MRWAILGGGGYLGDGRAEGIGGGRTCGGINT